MRVADNAPGAAPAKPETKQAQSGHRKSMPVNEPGIDMVELTKPPAQSYVMRTAGLSLIVIAIGLTVLYFVRWRERWSEVWRSGFGLRGKK